MVWSLPVNTGKWSRAQQHNAVNVRARPKRNSGIPEHNDKERGEAKLTTKTFKELQTAVNYGYLQAQGSAKIVSLSPPNSFSFWIHLIMLLVNAGRICSPYSVRWKYPSSFISMMINTRPFRALLKHQLKWRDTPEVHKRNAYSSQAVASANLPFKNKIYVSRS